MKVGIESFTIRELKLDPYRMMDYVKDGILFFSPKGVSRQSKAPGQGVVPFKEIIATLGEYNPQLPLSIEDHKWIFEFDAHGRASVIRDPVLERLA